MTPAPQADARRDDRADKHQRGWLRRRRGDRVADPLRTQQFPTATRASRRVNAAHEVQRNDAVADEGIARHESAWPIALEAAQDGKRSSERHSQLFVECGNDEWSRADGYEGRSVTRGKKSRPVSAGPRCRRSSPRPAPKNAFKPGQNSH